MNGKHSIVVVLTLALCCPAILSFADEEVRQPLPPGTTITMQNWQNYAHYLPQNLQLMMANQTPFKFPPDFRITIGQTHHYRWPTYEANTEKYSSLVKIVALPDGGHSISGYVAGLPFPNPQEPLRGWKALVNVWYRPLPWLECDPSWYLYRRDRVGNENITSGRQSYRLMSNISDPARPIYDPAAQGVYYSEMLQVMEPEQARYTAQLTLYYADPTRTEDLYVFVPALRRSLRLSSAARCSPVVGSDLTQDDVHTGWNGGIVRWDAKFLRTGWVPSIVQLDSKTEGNRANYFDIFFPKPSLGEWEMRPVDIIDVRRIPSQAAGYCYGKRIMYIDSETWANQWTDLYDANMKPWKENMILHPAQQVPLIGYTTDSGRFVEVMWDFQGGHLTGVTSAAPSGLDIRNNSDCESYEGENYTLVNKWNTVSALASIMR